MSRIATVAATQMACCWGNFRDRRPNLYGPIKTLDGHLASE